MDIEVALEVDIDEEAHQVEVVDTEVVRHLEVDIVEQVQDTAMKIVHHEMEDRVDMPHAVIVHHTLIVRIVIHVPVQVVDMLHVHAVKTNVFLCQEISYVKRSK